MAVIFRKQRGEARTRIAADATLRIGDFECPAKLLNASTGGVLAVLAQPPERGTRVSLVVGDMVLAGHVRWRGVDCCGIALRDPISVADLLDGQAVPMSFIPEPRGLRGIAGLLRTLGGRTDVAAS